MNIDHVIDSRIISNAEAMLNDYDAGYCACAGNRPCGYHRLHDPALDKRAAHAYRLSAFAEQRHYDTPGERIRNLDT